MKVTAICTCTHDGCGSLVYSASCPNPAHRRQARPEKLFEIHGWILERQTGRDIHGPVFFEAICPHGVGHHKGVHGCDGCCERAPVEVWSRVTAD